jgi:hypothetical protein
MRVDGVKDTSCFDESDCDWDPCGSENYSFDAPVLVGGKPEVYFAACITADSPMQNGTETFLACPSSD